MKKILRILRDYLRETPAPVALGTVLLAAALVFVNYHWGLEGQLMALPVVLRLMAWYSVFAVAFWTPYGFYWWHGSLPQLRTTPFPALLLLAPALFALKLALPLPLTTDAYTHIVLYYPYKLLLMLALLVALWRRYQPDQPFYGTARGGSLVKPYGLMLLAMVPLIALASLQKDFLLLYPKWQHMAGVRSASPLGKWLYELAYGSDFLTIEFFFRGFLVLAFARYAGAAALLPMAVFYCTIHFGKPLGECISSFFGGLLLGMITLRTRSIWGGLLVHLGIAWLMELGGSIGHQLRPELFGY